jgi:ribosomal protein S19E (S16A)
MTARDQVWDAVLRQLNKTGYFKISDLPFDESQRHTVRRVLREMEQLGWLERENDRAAIWRVGERGRLLLNVSAEKIRQAHSA